MPVFLPKYKFDSKQQYYYQFQKFAEENNIPCEFQTQMFWNPLYQKKNNKKNVMPLGREGAVGCYRGVIVEGIALASSGLRQVKERVIIPPTPLWEL